MSEISQQQREEIAKDAKRILNNFIKVLPNARSKEKNVLGECGGFRDEKAGLECNPDFRQRMFLNAPEKKGDFIIMERKKW